jgi:cytoskeletal protein RodZ
MSTVAEQLRAAREAQKLSVQQVADATKIRTDHINALEQGDFGVFPAPIYIRGSVKNYATRLKLDVPQIMATLDAELGRTEKFSEPPPLTEETKTTVDHLMFWLAKVNLKMVLAAAVVLGIIVLVLLANAILRHHGKSKNATGNLPPAVYQPANNGDTLPLPKK